MKKTPDPNAGAPRPRHVSAEDAPRPDMDHPPGTPGAATGFDRGRAQASRDARTGTLPGVDQARTTRGGLQADPAGKQKG